MHHSRGSHHLTEKQMAYGAFVLAILDVVVTLVFEHIGATYRLHLFDWRVLLAAFLICFGLFKYGQHIVHHSTRMVMKLNEPRPVKYGTYDFRVILGRAITKTTQWCELKKTSLSEKLGENARMAVIKTKNGFAHIKSEYELKYADKYMIRNREAANVPSNSGEKRIVEVC